MRQPTNSTPFISRNRRIRELDGLRAVAILLVLGCHYEGFSQLAWRVPELGWIGVDLFFCLSGYLITSILLGMRDRATPYQTFYARRSIRILPPYVAVILFVGIYNALHHQRALKWWVTQALFLQGIHRQEIHAAFDVVTHLRWYAHHMPSLLTFAHALPVQQMGAPLMISIVPFTFWSLSIEEYFYLLWAPVVLKLSRQGIVWTGVLICVVNVLLRWAVGSPEVYYAVLFKFDALIYGAFLALVLEYWNRTSAPRWAGNALCAVLAVALTGLAAIAFTIRPVLGRDPRSSPLVLAFGLPLLSLAFAALIGMLFLRAESPWWLGRLLRTPAFQFVGTISYTMYLVHLIPAALIKHLSGATDAFHQTFLQAVLSTLCTIGLAQLSWVLLEKKALEWKDRRFPNAPHPPEPHVPGLG